MVRATKESTLKANRQRRLQELRQLRRYRFEIGMAHARKIEWEWFIWHHDEDSRIRATWAYYEWQDHLNRAREIAASHPYVFRLVKH